MAWVWINGHRYYRRSRRVGGKVVTEHVGAGHVAELTAKLDESRRRVRRMERAEARLDFDAFLFGVADVFGVDEVLANLFALLAGRCGAYRHRRQWRLKRRADIVGTLSNLSREIRKLKAELDRADRARPLIPMDFVGVADTDREVLLAAAKGDEGAFEKAQPYLTDRRYVARWGNPMHAARVWLVTQASGENMAVAAATNSHADHLADDLGYQSANVLERLAITRVVHNWLMVGVLEVKACGYKPLTRERAQIERCLSQAERRLMQAIKALAFLRRVPAGAIVGQLPVAIETRRAEPPALSSNRSS